MSEWAQSLVGRIVAGVAVGLALGLVVGWLWPVQYKYANTAPAVLRRDYHDDYVLMVAASYQVEGDLERARERLSLLNADDPAAPVVDLAGRLVESGGGGDDVARLAQLAWALKAAQQPAGGQ